MAELRDLSTTDASNNGAASDAGFAEGMNPSDVNNAARALEGLIARHLADNNGTLATTGSGNAYVLAANATVTAYTAGDTYLFSANHTNSGASTINVDGLGTKALEIDGAAVASGDIENGRYYLAIYDGTAFQLTRLSAKPLAAASQAEMEAGTETALRKMSPELVKQAITALAPSASANLVINPNFQQWQYGTSFTPSGSASIISADAWAVRRGTAANYTVARQGSAGGYSLRVQRDSATSDTNQITLAHVIRSINAQGFFIDADQDVTLSFSAKKGANYSAASNYLVSRFWTGTGADQGAASMLTGGWTGSANDTQNNTLSTSFQTFTHTHTVPQNTTELGFDFGVTPVGTAGADDWFEIEWVKIEIGSSNTTFETPDYEDNLRACQTRKELIREATTAFSASTTSVTFAFNFKTTKHTDTPTIVLEDTSPAVQLVTGAPTGSSSAIASTVSRNRGGCAINVNGFTGLTGGEPGASRNGSGVLISVEDDLL